MKNIVAVYGTLKRGYGNHLYLRNSKFLGEGHTGPGYTRVTRGLPFLYKDDNGTGCQVELYEVTPLVLDLLDRLEGHPDWYEREQITVINEDDTPIKAWCYLMPTERMGRE